MNLQYFLKEEKVWINDGLDRHFVQTDEINTGVLNLMTFYLKPYYQMFHV